jgi:hypothetical protein
MKAGGCLACQWLVGGFSWNNLLDFQKKWQAIADKF